MGKIKNIGAVYRDAEPGEGYSDNKIQELVEADAQAFSDNQHFCGCCGGPCSGTELWCPKCEPHCLCTGPLWDRTYQAHTGEICPFTGES